ncbi:MAG: N-acetylmuramoyl-L-alanine amidase [Bacteroidia bacterium]
MKKYVLSYWFIGFFLVSFSQIDTTKITLVIDAGHGGKDPGNLSSSDSLLPEKDLNVKIAKKFGDYCQTFLGDDINIVFVREKDTFIELQDRIQLANDLNAEYFISIHCNASKNLDAQGTETHINTLESRMSLELAHAIQKELETRAGRNNRGVKVKEDRLYNLMVLKNAIKASVLIETGFMSNQEEELFLNSEHGQDLIASAIYRAFRDHLYIKYGIAEQKHQSIKTSYLGPVYKIQVYTSTGPISTETEDFKQLNTPIEEAKQDNQYKYYIGEFMDDKEAKKKLKEIQKIPAFKFAFVVRVE